MAEGERRSPEEIAGDMGVLQWSEADELTALCQRVVAEQGEEVAKVRQGQHRVLSHLVGMAMKLSNGRANPRQLAEIMQRLCK